MTSFPHDDRKTPRPAKAHATPGPAEQMMHTAAGYWVTQVAYAATRFRLAKHLRGGGLTAEAFARAEGLDAQAAHRFLRICASLGLATADRHGRFGGTPLLETLGRNHAEAMGSLADQASHEAALCLDTRSVDFVVDLGGADGVLLFALLRANPSMAGVVFAPPEAAPAAKAAVQAAGLSDRAAVVGGDVLQATPDEGDLYLLDNVLHDWDDEQCMTILRNCRRAMRAGGRVVVVERLAADVGETPMDMTTTLNGRERTLSEYRSLFTRVGLGNVRVTATETPMVILEAFAISDAWL